MSITMKEFGKLSDGSVANLYTLKNKSGVEVRITNYGGTIVSLFAPDRKGVFEDIVMGFDSLDEYVKDSWFLGCIVGRCAGRIQAGKLRIGEKEYQLGCNDGDNHIHGGALGFNKLLWEAEIGFDRLILRHISPDGAENYPGSLSVAVTYRLTDDNRFTIEYDATTDADTVVNLTNHTYFNLSGHSAEDVLSHTLAVHAQRFTPVHENGIPTGEIVPIIGSSLDFMKPICIGHALKRGIESGEAQMKVFGGIDHNFVLSGGDGMKIAVELYDEKSGRRLEIFTTKPGIQIFTANGWDNIKGKNGAVYTAWACAAFEPQIFPDAINNVNFPSPILRPEEKYHHVTEYRFSVC